MIHRREFKGYCEECEARLPDAPEMGVYIADGQWISLDFEGGGKLAPEYVKYWLCPECGETTWVYGFGIDEVIGEE